MRKIISYILVLVMALGGFTMSFATTDIVDTKCEDAVNLLMDLGVVSGYKDGTYRPEKIVTRAEMATLIIKALDLDDYAVDKSKFSDMAGHWADSYVAYASSLGFIAGYPDGTFRPNETVTYDEAITMMVQALGYKGEYLVGGYPAAFITQAKVLGILENITPAKTGANRGDVAILIYNSLNQPIVNYDKDGAIQPVVNIDTMLIRLGAELVEGEFIVGAVGFDSAIDTKDLQGALVNGIYLNENDEIIGFGGVESVFITGDYVSTGSIKVGDDEYKFKNVPTEDIAVFENGAYIGEFDLVEDIEDAVFAVKISGKYITDIYSVSTWTAEDTIQWDKDLAEELEEDLTFDGFDFIYDENDEIDHDSYVIEGVKSLKDIKSGHVVTYYVNNNDEIVKIEVATKSFTGTVKKISGDGDKYYINGVAYEIAVDGPTIHLGDAGKFYLDFEGKIAFFDKESETADKYAIVTLANDYETGGYDSENIMKIKLLTANGEDVFVIDEDIVVTPGVYTSGTVIKYALNKSGEISVIEPVELDDIEGKMSTKGYLVGHEVSKSVVVFINDGGEYTLGKTADIPTNETLTNSSMFIEDGVVEVIVLDVANTEIDSDNVYGVIIDYSTVKNEDDETVYSIEMLVDGKKVEYLSNDFDNFVIPTGLELYEVIFDGDAIEEFITASALTAGAVVQEIKDGNIKIDGKYVEISDNVIVYCVEENEFVANKTFKISDIKKNDKVIIYQFSAEDEDVSDIVIFW